MNQENKVAIYCRISKEDLLKSTTYSESIQNQKLLLIDYAIRQGFHIHHVYIDEDLSGFSDRPAFNALIDDARKGAFNIVLCKHQSRFTRDMELVEKYIHGHFVSWGIRFIGLTDHVDTNVRGNKKARQIYGLINEWYSEDLSENIKSVLRRKMEAGQFIGSFACYGYKKDPQNRHKLLVDDEAAAVVQDIFSLYAKGYSAKKIASYLSAKKIPTPTAYKQNQGLNFKNPNSLLTTGVSTWPTNTILRILRNETYIGTLVQGKEQKISYKSKKMRATKKTDWIKIKDNHAPLISDALFFEVQTILDAKKKLYAGVK